LSEHYLSNLALAQRRYRREHNHSVAREPAESQVVVVGGELGHNAAVRAHSLLLLFQQMGYPAKLLDCHFPLPNQLRVLWGRLQSLDLPVQALAPHL